jgi:hypothetical protein
MVTRRGARGIRRKARAPETYRVDRPANARTRRTISTIKRMVPKPMYMLVPFVNVTSSEDVHRRYPRPRAG